MFLCGSRALVFISHQTWYAEGTDKRDFNEISRALQLVSVALEYHTDIVLDRLCSLEFYL